jgi:galactokinase
MVTSVPAAIDRWTYVAAQSRPDRIVRIVATDFGDKDESSLDE